MWVHHKFLINGRTHFSFNSNAYSFIVYKKQVSFIIIIPIMHTESLYQVSCSLVFLRMVITCDLEIDLDQTILFWMIHSLLTCMWWSLSIEYIWLTCYMTHLVLIELGDLALIGITKLDTKLAPFFFLKKGKKNQKPNGRIDRSLEKCYVIRVFWIY